MYIEIFYLFLKFSFGLKSYKPKGANFGRSMLSEARYFQGVITFGGSLLLSGGGGGGHYFWRVATFGGSLLLERHYFQYFMVL